MQGTQPSGIFSRTAALENMLKPWPSFTLVDNVSYTARSPTPGLGECNRLNSWEESRKGEQKGEEKKNLEPK